MPLNLSHHYADMRGGPHARSSLGARNTPSYPFAVPVVLFGWGDWSRQNWSPVLVTLARWGVIHLTIVERWQVTPPELSALEQEGVLTYVPWEFCFESTAAPLWQAAFVVTSASAHARVIHRLLEKAPSLKVIACEKPCCENSEQAHAIFDACRRLGVVLLIADHYLLRPPVQHLIAHPECIFSLGKLLQISAVMNESKHTGPHQGVIADMLVHLLDLLFILFPGAHFTPSTAYIARALESAHTKDETYAFCVGTLLIPGHPPVPCQLECGKQLAEDRKELTFVGTEGKLYLDLITNSLALTNSTQSSKEGHLRWNQTWSYGSLILRSLLLSS